MSMEIPGQISAILNRSSLSNPTSTPRISSNNLRDTLSAMGSKLSGGLVLIDKPFLEKRTTFFIGSDFDNR